MNLRKIKLSLTVDLLNMQSSKNLLSTVKEKMKGFRDDVGNFIEQSVTRKDQFTNEHFKQSYSIKYEKCTLDIDLVTNQTNCDQYISMLDLQA